MTTPGDHAASLDGAPNFKHVGKSMFIINANEEAEEPLGGQAMVAQALKNKINQCVSLAENKPRVRQKLIESMMDLEL